MACERKERAVEQNFCGATGQTGSGGQVTRQTKQQRQHLTPS